LCIKLCKYVEKVKKPVIVMRSIYWIGKGVFEKE
jgi:hypothetical protein